MSKELEAYNEFLDIIEVPVKSHLLNSNDKQTLERYRVLRTQIETALERLEELEKEIQLKSFTIEVLNRQIKEKEQRINEISEVKLKQDEVLRIIKENFDIGFLLKDGLRKGLLEISDKDFELLKEWLK